MSRFIVPAAACILLLVSGSCDDSFNPSAPSQPRMVVYSILSNATDTQYVRLYTTYNPPNNDPSQNQTETSVTDAQVSISQDGGPVYTLRPLAVNRLDTSRYTSGIGAYYAFPFRPARGKKYSLTVSSPTYGVATATTTFPSVGSIVPDADFMDNPKTYKNQNYGVGIALGQEAKAFLVRFCVDYLSPPLGPGEYQPKRFEVPVKWTGRWTWRGKPDYDKWIFPWVVRRTSPQKILDFRYPVKYNETFPFQTAAFGTKLNILYCFEEGFGIVFAGAMFYLIQFDEPLWNYYNVSNSFRDPYSVRIDESSYSNIKGGVGMFGSSAVDSTAWPLPAHMAPPDSRICATLH